MDRIFAYENYTQYLKDLVSAKKTQGVVGLGQKLATAICCHPSLISQILKGHAHLSMEQAVGVAEYLSFTSVERDYFINLVLFERACNNETKKHFRERLDEIKQSQLRLVNRWRVTENVSEDIRAVYFRSWLMQAVHGLTQIESMQEEKTISEALKLPHSAVVDTLNELQQMGIVKQEDSRWVSTCHNLLIDRNSVWIKDFHRIWRSKVQNRLYGPGHQKDFHFSGILTFAEKDYDKFLEIMMQTLEKIKEQLPHSPSETASVLTIDFFRMLDPN